MPCSLSWKGRLERLRVAEEMVSPETPPHSNLLPYLASLEGEQVLFTQESSVRAEL